MLYRFEYTVPANTSKASPMVETMKLSPGTVEKVDISFPAGCGGLVGVRINRGLFQLWPLTVGEWFITDDFTVSFPGTFADLERPYLLTFTAYNVDDTYDHTITVQIAIEISVEYVKQLVELVTTGFPELKEVFVTSLVPLLNDTKVIRTTLTDRVANDLQTLLGLIEARDKREIKEMSLEELSVI